MNEDESYILKPRDVGEIVRTADRDGLTDLFESPLSVITESITGWLASGAKEWTLATGRIVQGAFKARLFQQVAAEINQFREKGKIPSDFAEHKNGFQTWVELFTVIDEETPDEERLEALKAMFLAVNRINAQDGERIVAYQLFQIAKRLGSNELLVLKKTHEMFKKDSTSLSGDNYREWTQRICMNLGHSLTGLIDRADEVLVENCLLTSRLDGGVRIVNENGRLTDLGIKFCENIERYQTDKKP